MLRLNYYIMILTVYFFSRRSLNTFIMLPADLPCHIRLELSTEQIRISFFSISLDNSFPLTSTDNLFHGLFSSRAYRHNKLVFHLLGLVLNKDKTLYTSYNYNRLDYLSFVF